MTVRTMMFLFGVGAFAAEDLPLTTALNFGVAAHPIGKHRKGSALVAYGRRMVARMASVPENGCELLAARPHPLTPSRARRAARAFQKECHDAL